MGETTTLIFGLPPIFGLLPLLLYVVLCFVKKSHPLANVLICFAVGAILTGAPFDTWGTLIYSEGLSNSLAMIGLIMMLGSGLGAVLGKVGVAENIVHFIVRRIGVNTENRAIISTMVCTSGLTAILATLVGANAVLAPILIPLVAAVGITPACLGVLLQAAGMTGMFIGPYSADIVNLLGLVNMSYPQYLIGVALPICIPLWIVIFFTAKRINRKTQGNESFGEKAIAAQASEYHPSAGAKRATAAFLIVIVGMVAYSMIGGLGAPYVITIMIVSAVAAGIAGGMDVKDLFTTFSGGMSKLVWMFLNFVLFTPYLNFVINSGAFTALAGFLTPLVSMMGAVGFTLMAAVIGIFGINGAAVAQMTMMSELFSDFVASLNLSTGTWCMILLVGSEITNFAYPAGQTLGQMGLARTNDVKSMLVMSYTCVIPVVLIVSMLRALIIG